VAAPLTEEEEAEVALEVGDGASAEQRSKAIKRARNRCKQRAIIRSLKAMHALQGKAAELRGHQGTCAVCASMHDGACWRR
jgi:hypothetical protein